MSSQKDYEAQRAQLQATLENLDASGGNGGADPAALPSASSTAKRRPRTSPAQTSSHHKKREQGWVTHTTSKDSANRSFVTVNKAGKPTSPKKKAAAGLSAPETLSHATAWEAFRLDLQIRQNKYLYKRDIADFKNLETLQADRAKQAR